MRRAKRERERRRVGGKGRETKWGREPRTAGRNEDGDDEAVNTNNTSHDARNDGLHHELRAHDSEDGHTDTGLGGTVGGTEGCGWRRKGTGEGEREREKGDEVRTRNQGEEKGEAKRETQ